MNHKQKKHEEKELHMVKLLKTSDKNLQAACFFKKILYVQNNGKDDSRLLVGNNITS